MYPTAALLGRPIPGSPDYPHSLSSLLRKMTRYTTPDVRKRTLLQPEVDDSESAKGLATGQGKEKSPKEKWLSEKYQVLT